MVNSLASGILYVPPSGDIIRFETEETYIAKGIEWKLFSERTVTKELLYKSNGVQTKVKIVGFEEYGNKQNTIIVEFEDGSLGCIHPAYLKEMQSSSFGKDSIHSGNQESSQEFVSEIQTEKNKQTTEVKQKKIKKVTAQPKLILPTDKVHFTAKIKEMTKKMNYFTGEEDEILLLEDVKIEGENTLDIGSAWCSYSKTLKKVEMEEGDSFEFDGKIVDKKFNKEIPYKINNPSKLKKI